MRIQDPKGPQADPTVTGLALNRATTTSAKAPVARAEKTEAAAKVTVSARARELADKAGIDTVKVDRLRASIADGSFKVDAKAIADELVESNG